VLYAAAFDGIWWVEQLVSWVLFGGPLVTLMVVVHDRWVRRKFTRWKLVTIGYDDPPQALYWEDVRRWLDSPRDLWVVVKGTVSGVCTLLPRTVDSAIKAGWVRIDRAKREIIVNVEAIPPEHLKNKKFEPGQAPKNWHHAQEPVSAAPGLVTADRPLR
jgi:hypothetical protein